MKTMGLILATCCLLLAPEARAGELDSEYGDKAKPVVSAPAQASDPSVAQTLSSELDDESPTQACFFRRRFFGHRGYGGYGGGYGGYGGYGGFGRGFW